MRALPLCLVLGLLPGCVGLDESPAAVPQPLPATEDEPIAARSTYASQPEPSEPGPTILQIPHVHVVDPAEDLEAARRALTDLDPADARWVEQQHRIALAVMLESDASTSGDRWSATLEAFDAAAAKPSLHQYAHADELLFDYAAIAFVAGELKRGQEQLLSLIRQYPTSPLVPHAYAIFADHMFEGGELENAAKLYSKLLSFSKPDVTAYAAYRIGWCHLRDDNGNDAEALEMFVRAIQASEGADESWVDDLRQAALNDAPLAYAQVGDPDKAHAFFTRLARQARVDPQAPLRQLALIYDELGDEDAAARICRELTEPC